MPERIPTAALPPEEIKEIAEQVVRILALQELEDGSAVAGLFARSTMSKVCSSKSVGCEIQTGALAAARA